MNLKKIKKRLVPSFLRRKKKEDHVANGTSHSLYEFSIDVGNGRLDVDGINEIVLNNPWCLCARPIVSFKENADNKLASISFHVLSEKKGMEVEKEIFEKLSQ